MQIEHRDVNEKDSFTWILNIQSTKKKQSDITSQVRGEKSQVINARFSTRIDLKTVGNLNGTKMNQLALNNCGF